METIDLTLNLKTIPDVMKRGAHALILVRTTDGKFVLGCKKIYPQGICRMVGGGIEPGENPIEGAARELDEELGLTVTPQELLPLTTVVAHISAENTNLSFTTHLYFYQLKSNDIKPASDLDGLAYLTETELKNLIARYESLPATVDPDLDFAWADYGQLYGPLHQIALEKYIELT